MKIFVILSVVVLGSFALPSSDYVRSEWAKFKQTHRKSYNAIEEIRRAKIFAENLEKIEEHNKLYEAKKSTYKMGVTRFADLTPQEFVSFLKLSSKNNIQLSKTIQFQRPQGEIPDEVDWRKQGAVTEVKDQGQCGSCWAFSVTGSLESNNFITNGKLVSLSEQELVDCSQEWDNSGCNGGFMEGGYEYVKEHGLAAEDDYPYEADDNTCRRGDIPSAVEIESYVVTTSGDEEELKAAVATVGPVSVAMDATDWALYVEGVFYDEQCSSENDQLNHGILAVGYGTDGNSDYWLIKNSWGPNWGENGYIKTARNANNNCGVATDACYPIVLPSN